MSSPLRWVISPPVEETLTQSANFRFRDESNDPDAPT